MYAKLDGYDYKLYFDGGGKLLQIGIKVDNSTDIVISDVATEINSSDGNVYVEGYYCDFKDIAVLTANTGGATLMIDVEEQEEIEDVRRRAE